MRPILRNAGGVASGPCGDEHVHPLRVGLRRLRAALRFSDDIATPLAPTRSERLAAPFQPLRRARSRCARRVVRAGALWDGLDDMARETLRKRVKRLRQAAEVAASLCDGEAVASYRAALAPVPDSAGLCDDPCVALAACRAAVGDNPRDRFAIGWLSARRDVLLAEYAAGPKAFARLKSSWKAHP